MDEHDDLTRRLRALGTQPIDGTQMARDLTAMAAVRHTRTPFGSKLRLAAAFLAGLLVGGTGLAAADALPDPAQHVAHEMLRTVGVDVPDPERYHGPECGAEVQRNHGGYVSQDKEQAKSDCGKPVQTVGRGQGGDKGANDANGGKDDGDPCTGRPAWAGRDMTDAERAAAQAERAACHGTESEEPEVESEEPETPETPEAPDVEETTTTTAAGPTTTTTTVPESTTEAEGTTTSIVP